jgi:hypothetical protein
VLLVAALLAGCRDYDHFHRCLDGAAPPCAGPDVDGGADAGGLDGAPPIVGESNLVFTPDTEDVNPGLLLAMSSVAATSGTAQRLHVYVEGTTVPGTQFAIGLYDDDQGALPCPRALLTSAQATAGTPGWVMLPVAPVSLTAGTRYWFGVYVPSKAGQGHVRFRSHDVSGTSGGPQCDYFSAQGLDMPGLPTLEPLGAPLAAYAD